MNRSAIQTATDAYVAEWSTGHDSWEVVNCTRRHEGPICVCYSEITARTIAQALNSGWGYPDGRPLAGRDSIRNARLYTRKF